MRNSRSPYVLAAQSWLDVMRLDGPLGVRLRLAWDNAHAALYDHRFLRSIEMLEAEGSAAHVAYAADREWLYWDRAWDYLDWAPNVMCPPTHPEHPLQHDGEPVVYDLTAAAVAASRQIEDEILAAWDFADPLIPQVQVPTTLDRNRNA